jgi:tetratricopeptide (TPR) repeat protein
MTIHGLGGCGKSALVLEFAYRALAKCARDLVFWVPAISRESFELAYRDIATRLQLPRTADPNTNINKLVKEALSADSLGRWLMIVDNADDPGVLLGLVDSDPKSPRLIDYLPHSHRGAILFTTRSRKAAGTLTPGSMLGLTDMSQDEARELLTQHIREEALLDDSKAIDQLLSILAYLPLAIVQAAAFSNNNKTSISDYVSLFQHAGAEIELFSEQFEDSSRYREMDSTIAKTWHISFDQIRKQDPLAAEYLSFMACIDRINIPQSLLPIRGSVVQRVKALGTLTGYAFITERQHTTQGVERERFFDMHRLVHMASTWWLDSHNEWATWAERAATRLEELLPYSGHERKDIWMMYLSHAIYVAGLTGLVSEAIRASLLARVGCSQEILGQFAAAESTHRQEISLREQLVGPEHLDTLIGMSRVALLMSRQGKDQEAEVMEIQMLVRKERVLGLYDPLTLASVSNLALLFDRQGKHEEAELMLQQTLAQLEKAQGSEHPYTLTSMNNLALVLNNRSKYAEAESMYRWILARQKTVLGVEHPDTLRSMNNLAATLDNQAKYEEAEQMNRQTLTLKEKLLGWEHPDTLTSMNNLARVLDRQSKYEEAESIDRQTLALREKSLGHENPATVRSISNLAGVLYSQGKYREMETMYRQILARREKVLGCEHLYTLTSMNDLTLVLIKQGKYEEAGSMNRHMLAQKEKMLGPEHPDTLLSV